MFMVYQSCQQQRRRLYRKIRTAGALEAFFYCILYNEFHVLPAVSTAIVHAED